MLKAVGKLAFDELLRKVKALTPNAEPTDLKRFLSRSRPSFIVMASVIVLGLAMALRIEPLKASRMISERQYRSALIARAYYSSTTDSVPEWRKHAAFASQQRAGILEPPITELLVSVVYQIVGGERLWIARLLPSAFWIVGGLLLFKIAEQIASAEAALFATAYYLLVPLGVVASASFLPDPLMIMLFLCSLFALVRYYERPSKPRLVIASVASGLAILVKPLCLFMISGAYIALLVHKRSTRKYSMYRDLATFVAIGFFPSALYYAYGILTSGLLAHQAQFSLAPQLILDRGYWKGWLLTAIAAVGYVPLIAALIGLPMVRKGLPRSFLIGLWIGYAIFCLVFTYHIRFADYYHLQLIVVVALSFCPLASLIVNHLRRVSNRWYWWLPVFGALLLALLFDVRAIGRRLAAYREFESEHVAREIGEIVGHSRYVAYLAPYYGMPLEYYGELSGVYWPRGSAQSTSGHSQTRDRSITERLRALDFAPEYFVITDLNEFDRHHADLKEFLANSCILVAESDEYLVYEACAANLDTRD
jgi:hypothetical protein